MDEGIREAVPIPGDEVCARRCERDVASVLGVAGEACDAIITGRDDRADSGPAIEADE